MADESTGVLDRQTWLTTTSPLAIDPKAVSAFFDAAGLNYRGVKQWAGHPDVVEAGFEPYALSPLVRWPLIQRGDGLYVAPVARDILYRPTRGFPIDVRQVVTSEAEGDVVKQTMGSTYEDYVEQLLRSALPQASIHRGTDVLPGDRLNCDFVCVEGRLVTLIETKAVHIRLKADMTKDFGLLRQELVDKGIGKGLAQLGESGRAIRDRVTPFPKNAILTGLLVVAGEQVFMNSQPMRSLLEDLAAVEAGRGVFIKYQIVNDGGLDLLTRAAAAGRGLGALLREKSANPAECQEDFEDFATRRLGDDSPPVLGHEHRAALRGLLVKFGFPEDRLG